MQIDIKENYLYSFNVNLLKILLVDRTTRKILFGRRMITLPSASNMLPIKRFSPSALCQIGIIDIPSPWGMLDRKAEWHFLKIKTIKLYYLRDKK